MNWTIKFLEYDAKECNRLISWIWRRELELFFIVWVKELNLFIRLKELNLLMNMTQRTKLFFKVWLKELNSFWKDDSKNWTLFWKYASKNLTLFLIRLKELIFSNMTQRIEPLFLIWLKNWNLFFCEHDSKNSTFLWTWLKDFSGKNLWLRESKLFSMTLELNFFFVCDSKNWTHFSLKDSQDWTPSLIMTHRILFFE